ncbi:hypothetical protein MNBD_GAMMA06-936 [hydrothermal vent metagenome]|uniref:PEP-CTERM protein-sorting domain-containing protein n=1 Tax=hydrothermal vent metagenome TaxID=652676 RepID=A0A3B0WFW5_9ZZZZ
MKNKILTMVLTLCALTGFSGQLSAAIYEVSYSGWFTLYDSAGNPIRNPDEPVDSPMLGWRTAVTGTATWDDVALVGTDSLDPFRILGGTLNVGTVNAVAIGDGFGGSGNMVMGNTLASWDGPFAIEGIPINNVGDLSGLFNAIEQGVSVGDTITGGALPASNDTLFGDAESGFFTLPLGPSAFASTFFNVTPLADTTLPGDFPSGGLPIVDDGIPGSPILATFFAGRSGAFDLVELEVISITTVPVPAAIWLFASGFVGLLGFARRRRFK